MEKKPDELNDHWRATAELLGLPPEPPSVPVEELPTVDEDDDLEETEPEEPNDFGEDSQDDHAPSPVLTDSKPHKDAYDDWDDDLLSFSSQPKSDEPMSRSDRDNSHDSELGSESASAEFNDGTEDLLPDGKKKDTVVNEDAPDQPNVAIGESEVETEEKPAKKRGRKRGRGKKGSKKKTERDDKGADSDASAEVSTAQPARKKNNSRKGKNGSGSDDSDDSLDGWGVPSWDELIGSLYRPDK